MKRAKKLSVIALTMVLSLSLATGTLANNGKGKGLDTAPGQSVNFSKGVTTEVIVTENVTSEVRISENTSVNSYTVPMSAKTISEEHNVIIDTYIEKHNTKDEYREVVVTATVITTNTSSWDETTTVTTTTRMETPVTIIETIETTILHQGAPGSNGKILSVTSIPTIKEIEGESTVTTTSETEVTKSAITTETITENSDIDEKRSGWKIGHSN